MAFPPTSGAFPGPGVMGAPPPAPFPVPPMGQPGILPMPPMPPGVMLPMRPPPMPPMSGPIISAPPAFRPGAAPLQARVPVISPSSMKVATTVFVGNISEKASDTLVRQILLRCGRIEGWKRVQDASGKLQAFGFCEYGDPESTLRALRILHDFRLGNKSLVVKVDSKTRVDLLKYILKKKKQKENETVEEEAIEKEVSEMDETRGTEMLKEVTDEMQKETDDHVITSITSLVRENVEILSSTSISADAQLEQDVKEAIFAMAKQSGKVDPDSTLDDMDMEDDMKTLVSDEIKKFRQSYERQAAEKHKLREKERERKQRVQVEGKGKSGEEETRRERSRSPRVSSPKSRLPGRHHSPKDRDRGRERSPRRDRSPPQRGRSPRRRSRSPSPRSRAKEKQEKEQRRREREREESLKEEEQYEERQRLRRQRERDKAYKERLGMWESRERRKAKEYEKEFEREEMRKDEMEREKRDLAEFLEDYDDEKDDQRYYKGSQYARRRRERELEKEDDERDRQREKEEIEALRLEVMERQMKERNKEKEGEIEEMEGSSESSSPKHSHGDEEDVDMPKVEMEEDIPLAKAGYSVPQPYPPIQVQSAPAVEPPELKDHPHDRSIGDGITIKPHDPGHSEQDEGGRESDGEDGAADSPRAGVKMTFGMRKGSSTTGGSLGKRALENVLGTDEEGDSEAPKKKLASIQQIEREQRDERKALEREVARTAQKMKAEERKKISPDERKKMIQNLVSSIPTTKEELFEYALKWDAIDQTLMEKRIGPWINKKIVEYIGEEEPTLTEFICNKLATHIPASNILEELAMVLDEEAEVFVVKLWRLLIYETEAKHLGIAKNY